MSPLGPQPSHMQFKRDWYRVAVLAIGVFALVVGGLLIVGIGVTSA